MPYFGQQSRERLATCDIRLQNLFNKVIKTYNCKVTCGHRDEEDQNKAYADGKSQLKYPSGNHNKWPSSAVDVSPYPVIWPSKEMSRHDYAITLARFYHFAGYVKAIAEGMGYKVRFGGDWDSDLDFSDQSFNDLPHFEILN